MRTYDGVGIYLPGDENHDPEVSITFTDMAVGLSRQPRFAGHTKVPFTVLGHSVCMSRVLRDDRLGREGLIHDAAEAVLCDMPSTLKLPSYKQLERLIMQNFCDMSHVMYPFSMGALTTLKKWDNAFTIAEAHECKHPFADYYFALDDLTIGEKQLVAACRMMISDVLDSEMYKMSMFDVDAAIDFARDEWINSGGLRLW